MAKDKPYSYNILIPFVCTEIE